MDNQVYKNLELVQDRIKDLKFQIEEKRASVSSGKLRGYGLDYSLDLRSLNNLLSVNVLFLQELEKEYKVSINNQ